MEDYHIHLYGTVGEEISIESVQDELEKAKDAKNIYLHISSPGGGVFEGWTIGNKLAALPQRTIAQIEGFCASIMTYIALSCDKVEMADTARFVVHKPQVEIGGDADELRKGAVQLDRIQADIERQYQAKTSKNLSIIQEWVNEETEFTTDEAIQNGFVDGKMTPLKAVAKFDIPKEKKMPDKKQNESIGKIEMFMDKIKNIFSSIENAVNVELEDGTVIYVESEDGELVGKPAFRTDEEGNPTEEAAPAGVHNLRDGRTITIGEDGTVTAVGEAGAPEETTEELQAKLEASLEESKQLKAKIGELTAKEMELTTANKTLTEAVEETKVTVSQLAAEVENLASVTVGSPFKTIKPNTLPENRFTNKPAETDPLEAWGQNLLERMGAN